MCSPTGMHGQNMHPKPPPHLAFAPHRRVFGGDASTLQPVQQALFGSSPRPTFKPFTSPRLRTRFRAATTEPRSRLNFRTSFPTTFGPVRLRSRLPGLHPACAIRCPLPVSMPATLHLPSATAPLQAFTPSGSKRPAKFRCKRLAYARHSISRSLPADVSSNRISGSSFPGRSIWRGSLFP